MTQHGKLVPWNGSPVQVVSSPSWEGCKPTLNWDLRHHSRLEKTWTLSLGFLPWRMRIIVPASLRRRTEVNG